MIKTFTINKGQKPTKEQIQEVMNAKKSPIVPDEDAPELSPAMYKAFKSSVDTAKSKEKCIKIEKSPLAVKTEEVFCIKEKKSIIEHIF